ncbi:MAG: hypothetical protein RBG1_1C00001G0759 [candidate division Zixibacteria bacterium RBG-1]|nr:MAG: hypothetical protein RBG1_1C00001G0759 [candidate division Zixibacteria bacterium RBG-1]OGC86388.1 MAG: hypothetical protein A2V73_02720 [candidate division Zixibacteria bacterium RBG_19FT_COMBO_42_43]
MKSFKVLLLAAIFLCSMVLIAAACEKSSQTSTAQAQCDHQVCSKKTALSSSDKEHNCCASKVKSASSHCEGVKESNLNLKAGTCEGKFDGSQTSAQNLSTKADKCCLKSSLANVETLEPAQKATSNKEEAVTQKAVLNVSGMTCGGCASEVKSALTKVNGVKECKVSWKEGKAEVGFTGDPAKANELVKAVNKTGFKASLASVESITAMEDDEDDAYDAEDADDSDDGEDADAKQMVVKEKETFKATSYVCEDCGYRQAKGGKCPSGNCKLTKVTEKHTFVCEECDYAQAKAGVCPSHKTSLVEYSVKYECPACHMVYETAGVCSMCKKQLQMVTDEPIATGKKMMSKEKATY